MTNPTSHYDEVSDVAEKNGLTVLYDNGEQSDTERQVVFGDSAAAADWDVEGTAGFQVVVHFSDLDGTVDNAHVTRDGVPKGEFDSASATISERLDKALNMVTAPHDRDSTF